MKRCVIVGGADITAYDRINGIITGEDYVIFWDRLSKRNIYIAVVKENAELIKTMKAEIAEMKKAKQA